MFVYGNSYDDVYRYERHIVFPKILAQNCEDFSPANTIYNADVKKSGSVRRHMTTFLSHEVLNNLDLDSLKLSSFYFKFLLSFKRNELFSDITTCAFLNLSVVTDLQL